jgi:hypothetical protein
VLLEFRALGALQRTAEELYVAFPHHRSSITGSVSQADTEAEMPAILPQGAVGASLGASCGLGDQASPMRGKWQWGADRRDSEPPELRQLHHRIYKQEERIRTLLASYSYEGGLSPAVCAFVVSLVSALNLH